MVIELEGLQFKFASIGADVNKRNVVFDVEANNLLHKVTRTWCIVFVDVITSEYFIFTDEDTYEFPKHGNFEQGVVALTQCNYTICQNYMGYDWFLLNKFHPEIFNIRSMPIKKCHDTFVQSKVQLYDRTPMQGVKGVHGLAYYGLKFNFPKPPIEDWSYWDRNKLTRCIIDVEINLRQLKFLKAERESLKKKGIDTEWQGEVAKFVQYYCTKQELNGFKADIMQMKINYKKAIDEIERLRIITEPQLPKIRNVKNAKATWEDVKEKWDKHYEKAVESGEDFHKFFDKVPLTKKEPKRRNGEVVDSEIKTTHMPTFKWKVKSGKYDRHTAAWFGLHEEPSENKDFEVCGVYTKIEYLDSTLSQHDVVKNFLLSLGWKPTQWTFEKDFEGNWVKDDKGKPVKKSPKITEDSFDSLPEGIGKIERYLYLVSYHHYECLLYVDLLSPSLVWTETYLLLFSYSSPSK